MLRCSAKRRKRTFAYTSGAHISALGRSFQSFLPTAYSGSGACARNLWKQFTALACCCAVESDAPVMARAALCISDTQV
jgi:hypothetical protein